jgi:sporulation-control protein spo0M
MTFRLGIRVKGTTDYLAYSDFKTVTSKSTVYTWSLMKELTVTSGVVYEISFFDNDDVQCNYPVSLYIDGNEHGVWVSAGGDEYPTWKPIINATWWTPCTLRALKSIINMTP